MTRHSIIIMIDATDSGNTIKSFLLNADNAWGQNKNRFILMYLRWRVFVGFHDEAILYFLIKAHKKNVVDGSFGHIKRRLKVRDTRTSRELLAIVEASSELNVCVIAANVLRR